MHAEGCCMHMYQVLIARYQVVQCWKRVTAHRVTDGVHITWLVPIPACCKKPAATKELLLVSERTAFARRPRDCKLGLNTCSPGRQHCLCNSSLPYYIVLAPRCSDSWVVYQKPMPQRSNVPPATWIIRKAV